ncbi:unnamed protein product [Durusdinium trenchii]|uniref:Chloroplastic (Protein MATURATION OF RBCL 1) (AtMRL1) n=2 Tax=Durusdinium trenchii TaxID=1381693 RepID=A0ABP0R720_9DINO
MTLLNGSADYVRFQGRQLHQQPLRLWNAKMASLARTDQWKSSLMLALQLQLSVLQPNIISETTCIIAWNKASSCKWPYCCHLLFHSGLQTDLMAFTGVMTAYEKGLQWKRALQLLTELRCFGFLPDLILLNSAISICEKTVMWPSALELFSIAFVADVISHTACISACEKGRRWRIGLGFTTAMRFSVVEPNIISCNAAMSACEKGRAWRETFSMAEDAADIISFTALMSAARSSWHLAVGLLAQLLDEKLRPDLGSCNSVVLALDTAAQWLQANNFIRTWSFGLPNCVTFASLLSASNACRQWQISLNLFTFALSMYVSNDIVMCDGVMKAHGLRQSWQTVYMILRSARAAGLEPTKASQNVAIACSNKAWVFSLQLLQSKSVDAATGNAALPYLNWRRALQLLAKMQADATSCSIVAALCEDQRCAPELLEVASIRAVGSLRSTHSQN